jgi:hypothetical protein
MKNTSEQIVGVMVAIVGLASLAVVLSKKSNAAEVIKNAGAAFTGAIKAAVSPITG